MAQWDTAFINSLPDSAFLYIEAGGSKDSEGKTTPRSLRHFPYKDANGAVDLPHLRNALARIPQSSLPQDVKNRATAKARRILSEQSASAEHDGDILRFSPADEELFELRDSEDAFPTLVGHFAVFDQWAEIASTFEGHFLERIAPGAFKKTFAENRRNMRVLFQHGKDPQIGEKILGPIDELREEERGAYYEVPLFDTSYNRDLMPALRSNEYGSSFRFSVLKESFDRKAKASEHNPEGLPERTITEAKVMEFGPVTFPAYEGATAGLRSATDWWVENTTLKHLEQLYSVDLSGSAILDNLGKRAAALPAEEPETSTPSVASRRTQPVRDYLREGEEEPRWRL